MLKLSGKISHWLTCFGCQNSRCQNSRQL